MKNNQETRVYWLLSILIGSAVLYNFLVTFLPIPKENLRFADTAQGFFLGTLISAIVSYYTGSSPKETKPTEPGTTTAEISATIHTETKEETP